MRYFFEIQYHGGHYHGWQNQANAIGVQQVVEETFSKLYRTPIKIVGSGRTDTGVHCLKQFFHVDLNEPFDKKELMHRLNSFLPRDIAIRNILDVKPDAHARHSATSRSYCYKITTLKSPLSNDFTYHYFKLLDMNKLNVVAKQIIGEHDFQSFSKVKTDVKHFRCHVHAAEWKQEKELILFHITANRFLRGMVRALVGTMLDVGSGKITVEKFEEILEIKDRKQAGSNVPPEGLCLTNVEYPKTIFV